MISYQEFRDNEEYLNCYWLNDFHKQKEFFKVLFELASEDGKLWVDTPENMEKYGGTCNWVSLHVMSIDLMLYVLARYGYVLQRSRIKLNYLNCDEIYNKIYRRDRSAFIAMLDKSKDKNAQFKEDDLSYLKIPEDVKAWIDGGNHLPVFFRPSINLKVIMSYLNQTDLSNNHMIEKYTIEGQWYYCIDVFLRYAAACGFVLAKSRKKVEFDSLEEILAPYIEKAKAL